MSVEIMTAVFNADRLTSTQKLVLLSLADHASEDGMNVYPGVKRLMIKTALSERTIRRTLGEFRKSKILKVERKSTRYKPTEYSIDLPALQVSRHPDLPPVPIRPARDAPLKPSDLPENPSRGARDAPKSSVNHQEELNHQLIIMITLWNSLFPNKPKPRPTTKSIQDKVRTRLKDKYFQDNWQNSMEKAATNSALQKDSWFNFRWFIKNDDNYQKLIDGVFDWKDKNNESSPIAITHPIWKVGDPYPGEQV